MVFTNDNGGPTIRGAVNGSSNAPLRASKCETFEGGIRVPLLVQRPGVLAAEAGPGQSPARDMLFDLAVDVGETTDLSAALPERLAELKARYEAWIAEVDADLASLDRQ